MAGVQTDIATQDSMGFQGAVPISGTALNSAGYTAVQFSETGTLTSIAGLGFSGTWTAHTFPAGFIIRGRITSFQLASGRAVAYLARA